MFFILEGEVEISHNLGDVRKQEVVSVLGAGRHFGELSLLRGTATSAYVKARTACECQVLYRQDYDVLKMSYPELEEHLQETVDAAHYTQLSPFVTDVPFFQASRSCTP